MIRQVICPVCGSNFTTTDHRRKYCSKECAKIANTEQKKQWMKDNYEYYLETQKEYRKNYYRRNRGKILKRHRKYYLEHKEEYKSYRKNYYHKHRDEVLEHIRNYNLNKKINICSVEHNNCFDCPTEDGECLFD